jgi:hypothetical protein
MRGRWSTRCFLACGLLSSAGEVGGGVGEEGVSGGEPAASAIGQAVDDEHGFGVNCFLTLFRGTVGGEEFEPPEESARASRSAVKMTE